MNSNSNNDRSNDPTMAECRENCPTQEEFRHHTRKLAALGIASALSGKIKTTDVLHALADAIAIVAAMMRYDSDDNEPTAEDLEMFRSLGDATASACEQILRKMYAEPGIYRSIMALAAEASVTYGATRKAAAAAQADDVIAAMRERNGAGRAH